MSTAQTRRDMLAAGIAAAVLSGAGAALAAEDPGLKFSLSAYEKIPAQKYPWGWIRWLMNAEIDSASEMTVGIVFLEAHQTNPLHVHPNSGEVLHVLCGSCEHRLGARWDKLKAGDTLRIPKDVPHQARTQDGPCLSMVVYNTGKRQMVPVTEEKPA